MKSGKTRSKLTGLVIAAILTAVFLVIGLTGTEQINAQLIGLKLLRPLLRLMLFISIGLMVGQLIEASGWTRYLAAAAAPLFRFGKMGPLCSAAFTTAFFSGIAANSMLYDFYKEAKISKYQLYLANFINQLPAYFLHLPTTLFIVVPLTGRAGIYYFGITFTAVVLRTAFLLAFGHFKLPGDNFGTPENDQPGQAIRGKKKTGLWERIAARFPSRIMGIATYVIPIYTLVFVLNAMGLFDALRDWLAGVVVTHVVPVESLSVIVLSFVAEFSSGFAAAGALMEAGILTTKQTVLALVIGNITAFPVRALRHQLPRYMGIFTPKMGGQILLMGQGFRIASIIIVAIGYYLIG